MTPNTKEKAPGALNTKGLRDITEEVYFATQRRNSKETFTQIAELALRGHAVYALADGGFLVSKYGYTHHSPDFKSLKDFAQRLGVKQ